MANKRAAESEEEKLQRRLVDAERHKKPASSAKDLSVPKPIKISQKAKRQQKLESDRQRKKESREAETKDQHQN